MTQAELEIKQVPLKSLVDMIVDAVLNKREITNSEIAKQASSALSKFVGTSLEVFEEIEFVGREFLRTAATVVSNRYSSVRSLYGFLRNTIGQLNKITKAEARDLAKIAIFLTGLFDVQEAARLKSRMIAYI